jgi:Protein of unknown function (DUF1598)
MRFALSPKNIWSLTMRSLKRSIRIAGAFAILLLPTLHASDQAVDDAQTASQLKMEARLAAERGDFSLAAERLEVAARMSGNRQVAERAGEIRRGMETAGGNQFANFTQLIQLIQDQTSPPARWFDVDGEGGRISQFSQGVFIGSPAVLASMAISFDDSRLLNAANFARTANGNDDVEQDSLLRLVSLTRLEKHVEQLLAEGKQIPEDVLLLAGLTEIRFLFLFPETNDVVIGGPAGAWKQDDAGRAVGVNRNRPVLHLDDLVTLSRTFSRDGAGYFMCSIDPKQQQVVAVKNLVTAQGDVETRGLKRWTQKLEDTLGLQNVIIQGIPTDSRVASVIVDADYRMKQIGIGRRRGPSGMKSYFDLISRKERRSGSSMDALRWWLTVAYDAIRVAPDGSTFELTGRSIQCLSENQLLKDNGQRESSGGADKANTEFARLFTKHLPALAEQDLVFADLQNVFDLSLVSALIHSQGLAARMGWKPDTFSAAGEFATASVEVPEELMTAANFRIYRDGAVVIQVAGGVQGDVRRIVRDPANFTESDDVTKFSSEANPIGHSADRWWWDAAIR